MTIGFTTNLVYKEKLPDHITHFKFSEFDQDKGNKHGMYLPKSGNYMELSHLEKEQHVRYECAKIIPTFRTIITDGIRTPEYNTKIGGAKNSAHLLGLAADRSRSDPTEAYYEIKFALEFGMTGIGIKISGPKNGRFIHLDSLLNSTRPNIWTYPVENFLDVPKDAIKCHGDRAYDLLRNAYHKGFTCILINQPLYATTKDYHFILATNDAPKHAPVLLSL